MPRDLSEEQWTQVEAEIFAGRKIAAIKLLREFSGMGLAEAKSTVEEHEAYLRSAQPERFTRLARSSGCSTSVVLLAVACAALAAALG